MAPVATGSDHWWQNWSKTHAYVAGSMFFPTSVDEIASAVTAAEAAAMPLRAFGGGWSFGDAVLPGNVMTNRPNYKGADSLAKELPFAEGFPPDNQSSIASIDPTNAQLFGYDGNNVRATGNAQTPASDLESLLASPGPQPEPVALINTRSLKSALSLHDISSAAAQAATAPGTGKFYFHVEAGIRMDELGALLDCQSPRLQLGASGGNPGATLGGTISTATHGAEFKDPLLINRVLAVHLVGPGGQQWWIEGATSVADRHKLAAKYPGIRIIGGNHKSQGLAPQDWLNAVVVSMGCIGVIYSVVLDVPALGGNQQVTMQGSWLQFLGVVGATLPGAPSAAGVIAILRNPADPNFKAANHAIAAALRADPPFVGKFNGQTIGANQNVYADLAFNPNPIVQRKRERGVDDRDIWIVNRQVVPTPFDSQPPQPAGFGDTVNSIFKQLKLAFNGDVPALVARLAQVYGITDPLHIDVPLPHADIAPLHVDITERVDITPHVDVTDRINIDPHIDTPAAHIDVAPHLDIGPHVDVSVGFHADLSAHADLSPHIDIAPHVDIAQHIDVAPHADIAQHIDVAPHVDVTSPHIDLSPGNINIMLGNLLLGAVNPLLGVLSALFGVFADAADVLEALVLLPFDLARLIAIIVDIGNSSDQLDVALGDLTGPIADARALDIAQPLLTGILAAVLGTSKNKLSLSTGTSVGAIGFPDSGLVGAAVEIALPVDTAFGFLQSQVLDPMAQPARPLFGYVSVRLCPRTTTLMGMQQWPESVMIEVVAFGDDFGKAFISQLQKATLAFIAAGNDAMLHWGLENDQLAGAALGTIPALQRPTASNPALTQLQAFKAVRQDIFSNRGQNPPGLFPVFDNAFTTRLGL
jgi:hypothetical protein